MLTRRIFLMKTAMLSATVAVPSGALAEMETALTLRLLPEKPVTVPATLSVSDTRCRR